MISFPILDKLEESRFWGKWEKSAKSKGLEPWITPRLEVDNEPRPSTKTHERNQRKTPQIAGSKLGPKIPLKITKMKNIAAQDRRSFNPKARLY
jgi:hypothetical protein